MTAIARHWLWFALLAAGAMLGAAHAFETFGGLSPCELCLKEREVYWLAMALAAVGLALARFTPLKTRRWVCAALALVFLFGAGLATYHAGAEWKFWPGPASCSGGAMRASAADMARLLSGASMHAPSCDQAAWIFLGVSMAGWNALISVGLAVSSAVAAWARPA